MPELPDRRAQRLAQVQLLTDEEFAGEVRRHQGSRWRTTNLESHARKHRRHFIAFLGRVLSPTELDVMSGDVLRSWDRLFTELGPDGSVTYVYLRSLPRSGAGILVATRGGYIRTMFPTASVSLLLQRPRGAGLVEVTDRAKGLGLLD